MLRFLDIVPPLNAMGFWDTFRAWSLGLAQCLPKGRLLKYDRKTKEAHVIAKVSAAIHSGVPGSCWGRACLSHSVVACARP
jgi:hypothetical protein